MRAVGLSEAPLCHDAYLRPSPAMPNVGPPSPRASARQASGQRSGSPSR